MVQDLLQPGNPVEVLDCSSAHCDEFAIHFEGKITQFRSGLDSTVTAQSEDVSSVPCLGQILMDQFQLLRPEDVDRVLGSVRSTTTLLDPCPSWLIGSSARGVRTWVQEAVNTSFDKGSGPYHLERGGNSTTS